MYYIIIMYYVYCIMHIPWVLEAVVAQFAGEAEPHLEVAVCTIVEAERYTEGDVQRELSQAEGPQTAVPYEVGPFEKIVVGVVRQVVAGSAETFHAESMIEGAGVEGQGAGAEGVVAEGVVAEGVVAEEVGVEGADVEGVDAEVRLLEVLLGGGVEHSSDSQIAK